MVSCTLSSALRNRGLSAKLQPVVGAGAVLARLFWFRGWTLCYRQDGVNTGVVTDVITAVGVNVVLGVGVGVIAGFGFGFGFDFNCLPGCSCWRSLGLLGQPGCIRSACIAASTLTHLVSAFCSSLWPHSIAVTTLLTLFVMPLPHSQSSWWYVSHFSSFSSNHLFIPSHGASCSAVCVSSMFAILALLRCSCASSQACCCAVRSIRLPQPPGPTAGTRASLILLQLPWSLITI